MYNKQWTEVTVYIFGDLLIQHLEFRKTWNADTIVEDYKPPEVRCTVCQDVMKYGLDKCWL